MIAAANQTPTTRAGIVPLTQEDLAEVSAFIAIQSGRNKEEVESHLRWFWLSNPALQPSDPRGFGLRSASSAQQQLVGCILCIPQHFRRGDQRITLMGSSSFYVDEGFRGHGGRLFLQYSRLARIQPLFGTSANAQAAALWKAAGAVPIANCDCELFGVLRSSPLVEEFAHRRFSSPLLTRIARATIVNQVSRVCGMKIDNHQSDLLQPLPSPELIANLPLNHPSSILTALRDLPYMRWRYFSGQDPTAAAFVFRTPTFDREILVTVNERRRGYRNQIVTLNLLDVYPEVSPQVWLRIVNALIERYCGKIDAVVLRNQSSELQSLFCAKRFKRRIFDAPTGWFLDKSKSLASNDFYFVPADGDALI